MRTGEDFRWLNTAFSVHLQVQRDFVIDDYHFTPYVPYVSAEITFDIPH